MTWQGNYVRDILYEFLAHGLILLPLNLHNLKKLKKPKNLRTFFLKNLVFPSPESEYSCLYLWFVADTSLREDGVESPATRYRKDDSAEDHINDKRSSVSWLLATTLRMCKTKPTSCFRSRMARLAAKKRSQLKPSSALQKTVGLKQQLILSS